MSGFPQRKILGHTAPSWVKDGSLFFITICTEPRFVNQLCLQQSGPQLLRSVVHYQQIQRWWIRLFLLMPDHVHALMAVPKGGSLPTVIKVWKAYQAKSLGIRWQVGFFDHRLRSDESEQEKSDYIRMNPVRAGLVARPEAWPYFWPRE